jgi:conjugal transfer pilus assembly protein TraF
VRTRSCRLLLFAAVLALPDWGGSAPAWAAERARLGASNNLPPEASSNVAVGEDDDASAQAKAPAFWGDRQRGWFWYEDPPPKLEHPPKPLPPVPSPPSPPPEPKKARRIPKMADYTIEQLWTMHPDDFQELLMDFMKKAVQDPTSENATEYMVMQDIARRKSVAFANSMQFVTQMNPVLAAVARDVPITQVGVNEEVRQRRDAIRDRLALARDDYALVFFTNANCRYCREFRPILVGFMERTGWDIKAVDTEQRPDLAARFGVTTTPTLFLVSRELQKQFLVTVGVISQEELAYKTWRAVRYLEGEAGPEDFTTYPFQQGGALDPESIFEQNPIEAARRMGVLPVTPQR